MNTRNRKGGFCAAKVSLFLNEYNGIGLEDFCKAEDESYSKMYKYILEGREHHA